ncbi:MAG: glycosyltransferase family 39 protein [Gemmatimonadaceae bacterium]|nr:glycosyltransferase family 39 protein [Gemmatimonadaceae bacterium]
MVRSSHRPLPLWSLLGLVLVVAIGAARIIATYEVFSETFDEGVHIAAGMELLDRGRFTYEPKHPPLARAAVALGPWLSGVGSQGVGNIWGEGRSIIHAVNADRTLFLARLGVLPFFVLAACLVWAWARRIAGDGAGLAAVTLFTTAPPVLAHSSVATTDMALVATLIALLFAAMLWVESPTTKRSVWLGIAGAAALTAKLSSIAFFGLTALLVLALRHVWAARDAAPAPGFAGRLARWLTLTPAHLRRLLVVAPVAFLAVWTVYRFQVGSLRGVPFPLTTLIQGVRDLAAHNGLGHASFLLGEAYADGRWLFFPVGLAVKSPLTLLVFGLAGAWLLARRSRASRDWQIAVPLLLAVAILAVSIPARINIGVRHVLPVFATLAIAGGVAVSAAFARWKTPAARSLLAALATAGLVSTFRVHPDYLAYFNELAGAHPERVLVDSDLDWGQDLRRLRDTIQARGIDSVTTAYFGSAVPGMYGIPVKHEWVRGDEAHGWFAVSQTRLQRGDAVLRNGVWTLYPEALAWLRDREPEARIGRSILLYRLP